MRLPCLVVSRHPAAVEFIARHIGGMYDPEKGHVLAGEVSPTERAMLESMARDNDDESHGGIRRIPVIASATADDVRGKIVAGNLPFHLAALCAEVVVVEFDGPPPRGQDYTIADMVVAGARLASYVVQSSEYI